MLMIKQLFHISIISILVIVIFAFNQPNESKIEMLQAKNITYVQYSFGCPTLKDTYKIYGFKITCAGCSVSKRAIKKNKRAIRKIDSIYGKGWFDANYESFIIPFDK